jgi:hypothetical protein
MRIGPVTRSIKRPLASTVALAAFAVCTSGTNAQAPPSPYSAPMPGPGGYYSHDPMAYGGAHHHFGGPKPGFTGPMPMGYGGTTPPVGYDMMNDVGVEGYQIDQRGPHYFDVRAEAVYLKREDDAFGPDVDFSQEDLNGPIVLSSSDLEYDEEPGFRIIGRLDVGPLSVFEFGYMGIFSYEDEATFEDPDGTLFSLFSAQNPGEPPFGVNPVDVSDPDGPLPFTERAIEHSISIESTLQTAELTYRRYWVGWIPRISGTLLAGFRYTRLGEEFEFNTIGTPNVDTDFADPNFSYDIDAINNLAGFQTGADIWVGLMQGLRIGAEGKAGIYNNHYSLENFLQTRNGDVVVDTIIEDFDDNKVAFLAEASADVVANVLPSVSLRAGYEVLFFNSLVLAGENFNEVSPFGNQGVREAFVEDDGELFYHGGHAGIEFVW